MSRPTLSHSLSLSFPPSLCLLLFVTLSPQRYISLTLVASLTHFYACVWWVGGWVGVHSVFCMHAILWHSFNSNSKAFSKVLREDISLSHTHSTDTHNKVCVQSVTLWATVIIDTLSLPNLSLRVSLSSSLALRGAFFHYTSDIISPPPHLFLLPWPQAPRHERFETKVVLQKIGIDAFCLETKHVLEASTWGV